MSVHPDFPPKLKPQPAVSGCARPTRGSKVTYSPRSERSLTWHDARIAVFTELAPPPAPSPSVADYGHCVCSQNWRSDVEMLRVKHQDAANAASSSSLLSEEARAIRQ